jgi:hypothetical protein
VPTCSPPRTVTFGKELNKVRNGLDILAQGMDSDQRTALSGNLVRWRKNIWAWSHHSAAPDDRELSSTEYYNFRIRNRRWIEVLVRLAREKEALHWVTRGGYKISLSGYHYGPIVIHEDGRMTRASQNGKVIPEVYLVPISDWETRDQCLAAQLTCDGAQNDR